MSPLPVLVPCDRLRARLTAAACVGRYTARVRAPWDRWESARAAAGVPRHPECAGCPQGAARARADVPAPAPVAVPTDRREAVAAIIAGRVTVAQVAEAHGVTVTAVRYWLRLAGVARHSQRGTPVHPRRAEAEAAIVAGDACSVVAARLGLHISTVQRWAQEARAAT